MKKDEALQMMLNKARTAQDPTAAECWIITAKTLGATYDVDLVSYQIQCDKKNSLAAAETLQQMYRVSHESAYSFDLFNVSRNLQMFVIFTRYMEFSNEPRFWNEVTKIIEAVKQDSTEESIMFYKAVFQQMLPAMQQTLLLEMAEKQQDKIEQCRYLLLLFRLFPENVGQFGIQLITVLSELEKSLPNVSPHENVYCQLLVYEIIPILLKSVEVNLEESLCIQLLKKAIQFYVSLASSGPLPSKKHSVTILSSKQPRTPKSLESKDALLEMDIDNNRSGDPWESLLQSYQLVAQTHGWDIAKKLKNLKMETLKTVAKLVSDSNNSKPSESLYTALLIFVYLAYKQASVNGVLSIQSAIVVIPAEPTESDLSATLAAAAATESPSSSPVKKQKLNRPQSPPAIASGVLSSPGGATNELYLVASYCVKILKANRSLINSLFPDEKYLWLDQFLRDVLLCTGHFQEIFKEETVDFSDKIDNNNIGCCVQLISCKLLNQQYDQVLKFILSALKSTAAVPCSVSSMDKYPTGGSAVSSDWHYADLRFDHVTSYACRVVFHCMYINFHADSSDFVLGTLLILCQLDYGKYCWLAKFLFQLVQKRKRLVYPKLLNYIVVSDILENLAYYNAYENELFLEIVDPELSRKTGHSTRHSTRGAKGDIRAALESQMAGDGNRSSIEDILKTFILENETVMSNYSLYCQ